MPGTIRNYLLMHQITIQIFYRTINYPGKLSKLCQIIVSTIIWILVAIISFPVTIVILFFTIYKHIITVLLKCRYKNNFQGLVTGCSATITLLDNTMTINDVYLIKSLKSSEIFTSETINHLKKKLNEPGYQKLLTSRHKFMGYLYNRNSDLKTEEIIKVVKSNSSKLNKEELLVILDECTNTPMPDNNKSNFDVFIITTPFDEKFVVLVRMHHSLVDGCAMYNLSTNLLCKKTDTKNKYADLLKKVKDISETKPTHMKHFIHNRIYSSFYTPTQTLENNMNFFTDPTDKYFKTIRCIMKKHQVTFQDVILSAMSYSISQSYPSINKDELIVTIPRQVQKHRMVNLYQNNELFEYGNDFAAYNFAIPYNNQLNHIVRLEAVHKELHNIHETLEFWFFYAISNCFCSFPSNLLKLLYGFQGTPLGLTNFPGGPKLDYFNDDSVEDKFFYCPKTKIVGILVALYTYDDRLQFAVVTEKSNTSEIQNFTEGILQYLDEVANEINVLI